MGNKLVSYCLFTYNQEAFIKEALEGIVNQTYSPLEVIISDDGSKDSTFQMVESFKKSYTGPHNIIINQNKKNLGIGAHVSKVLCEFTSGEYIVVLGGDDISKPEHVTTAVEHMERKGDVSMIDFNGVVINEKSEVLRVYQNLKFDKRRYTLQDYLKFKPVLSFAPGRIFTRELVTSFGKISDNCPTEDSVLVIRSLLLKGLVRVNQELVYYRIHTSNSSGGSGLSKTNHLAIITQYISDIVKLFNEKRLSEKETEVLLERVMIDYKMRRLRYSGNQNLIKKSFGRLYSRAYLMINKLTR